MKPIEDVVLNAFAKRGYDAEQHAILLCSMAVGAMAACGWHKEVALIIFGKSWDELAEDLPNRERRLSKRRTRLDNRAKKSSNIKGKN